MAEWQLINCEDRADRFPVFKIPSRILREGLSPGNSALIVFAELDGHPSNDIVRGRESPWVGYRNPTVPTGERLWMHIVERRGAAYVGTVASNPRRAPVRLGERIEFGPEHICAWELL